MSGYNMPDGCSQAEFDRAWADLGGVEDDQEPQLDEPEDIDIELLAYWQERSELFTAPEAK